MYFQIGEALLNSKEIRNIALKQNTIEIYWQENKTIYEFASKEEASQDFFRIAELLGTRT